MTRSYRPRVPGHSIVHFGVALVCFTRAFAYTDWLTPPIDSPGPIFLTNDGQWLGAYAAFWALVGVLAVYDGIRGQTSWAIPAFIGIMAVWGFSYAGAWWVSGYTSPDWMTAALYWGCCLTVLGGHLIVAHLHARVIMLAKSLNAAAGCPPRGGPHE